MGLLQELGRRQPQHRRIPAVDALCGRLSLQFADPGCLRGSLEKETTILMRTSGNVPRNTSKPMCGILAHPTQGTLFTEGSRCQRQPSLHFVKIIFIVCVLMSV